MAMVLKPIQKGCAIPIDKPVILIGRHPGCDVILQRSPRVSRKHCCIAQAGDRVLIRDLGSRNGVWVNGKRIAKETELRVGDEVRIGDLVYRVEQARPAPGKRPSKKGATTPRAAPRDQSPPPLDLSQDVPVPIPEPGESGPIDLAAAPGEPATAGPISPDDAGPVSLPSEAEIAPPPDDDDSRE